MWQNNLPRTAIYLNYFTLPNLCKFFSYTNETEEEYNDAAFFQIEVHDDLGEPKEQLGMEMERVSNLIINYYKV